MSSKPLTNISISFSGGGYRAASFHLGVLSYLNAVTFQYADENPTTLLERVETISTNSGGTFTGVLFALKEAKGQSFKDFFKKLHHLLEEDKLLERVFDLLNGKVEWKNESKRRNMINAFSEVYHEHFFDQETFGTLLSGSTENLTDFIFNATDFTNGLHFRFQNRGLLGNGKMFVHQNAAGEVRLADIVAASSCFPLGFEPIIFPDDFECGEECGLKDAWANKSYPSIGLMDGGIVDNQGIDGILKAESRNRKVQPAGTYIISDVSSNKITPFKVLKKKKHPGFISIQKISLSATIIFLLSFAGVILSTLTEPGVFWSVLSWVTFIFSGGFLILFRKIWNPISNLMRSKLELELPDLNVFKSTPIPVLQRLILTRLMSAKSMTNDVFLKRIRDLQIGQLYRNEKWNFRLVSNNIYSLKKESADRIGKPLKEIIETANKMPTTLWFTKKETENQMLKKLIICGQVTICHNLIQYVDNLKTKDVYKNLSENDKLDLNRFYAEQLDVFEKFKHQPDWLFEELSA